jgi:hypothetical protein
VVTLVPNQFPGLNSPGFPPSSGAFTLDLANAIERMEQDSTPKALHQPSPKDGIFPPVSQIPSADGRTSTSAAQGSISSIGGINIVLEKFFNQPPISASWADQVEKEEVTHLPSVSSSVKEEADHFPSVSVLDFHTSLYNEDVNCITRPKWFHLSQGDATEHLPEGFGHWDGKWMWLSLTGSCQHTNQEMLMVLWSLVMIQRWLIEAAKWKDFKVVDVGQYVVDIVAVLKDSGNTRISLNDGQSTDLGTALKIVMEGDKPFNMQLITPGVAMDTSEDFQTKAAAVISSSPALSYATIPPKRKTKGKGKAKANGTLAAPLGAPDNAIVILDSAPPAVPTNAGPPLCLTPLRANQKVSPGLPPPINKVPLKAPAHPPCKAVETPTAKQFKSFAEAAKSPTVTTGTRLNPINIPSPSPAKAQKIVELVRIYGDLSSDRILAMHRAMVGKGRSSAPPTPPSQMRDSPGRI